MRQRIPALDSLRGIAVLAVIVFHGSGNRGIGWAGVDVFFVLSGFLITGILLDAKGAPDYYRHFYARRARRILPVYYGTLALLVFVLPHLGGVFPELTRPVVSDQLQYWTFLGNVRAWLDSGQPTARHFWSLAIEEQFYLMWPLVVAAMSTRQLARVCLTLIIGAFALRVALAPSDIVHFALFTRVDTLAAGAWVAVAMREGRNVTRYAVPVAAGAVGVLLFVVVLTGTSPATALMQTVGYSAFAVGSAAIIALAANGRFPSHPALARVGTYSYAAYVFHMPVLVWARLQWPNADWRLYLPLTLLVTLAIASLSWRFVESRMLNRPRRYTASSAPSHLGRSADA